MMDKVPKKGCIR